MNGIDPAPRPAATSLVPPQGSQTGAEVLWATGTGRTVEIVQTVLTGLMLAFVFRAFFVEPFIIPTGSMADALLGRHAVQTCPACGWEYGYAPLHSTSPFGADEVWPATAECPNCHCCREVGPEGTSPRAGDRILVHKWTYALGGWLGPKRWEVAVFRDPASPGGHYIKRVVGLPGETVEIVDGDIYVNDQIVRKPAAVQQVLWFVVFDQAHLATPGAGSGRLPRWVSRDPPDPDGRGWTGMDSRVIRYDGLDHTRRKIVFNCDASPEYLTDFYAYDRRSSGTLVGDVRIVSEVTLTAGTGLCRWELVRLPCHFFAQIHRQGSIELGLQQPESGGHDVILRSERRAPFDYGRPLVVEFGHVDYRVYLRIDNRDVLATTAEQYGPQLDQLRSSPPGRPVKLSVAAENLRLELRGLRVDRDVHYTSHSQRMQRAGPGNPFTLGPGEYFVLGDNSPDSHDSREWTEAGHHLPKGYRLGTVTAEQIVGQAAFVYLPGLLPLGTSGRWLVPDVGRVRFVR